MIYDNVHDNVCVVQMISAPGGIHVAVSNANPCLT